MDIAGSSTERAVPLVELLRDWHSARATREQVIEQLVSTPQGCTIREDLLDLIKRSTDTRYGEVGPAGTEDWRQELLACKARAWSGPDAAGLLVGPSALLLSDGDRAALLDEAGIRILPSGIARSLLLLAQTIVMADEALDAQEIDGLRRSRVQATSSSLSEITPVH